MFNLDIKDRAKTLIEIRDLILPDIDKEAWTLSAYLWASGEYGLTLKHGYSKTGYLEIRYQDNIYGIVIQDNAQLPEEVIGLFKEVIK